MESAKFILSGEDKKLLSAIKSTLSQNGYVYTGYTKEPNNLLRHIRSLTPELAIIGINGRFKELRPVLEIMDEELLSACVLVLNSRTDEAIQFCNASRVFSYIVTPVYDDMMVQISDMALANYKRVAEYEGKIKKLNDNLETRKYVEKAKWILVEQQGYSEAKALEVIRKKSRENRLPMRNVAEAIILTRET